MALAPSGYCAVTSWILMHIETRSRCFLKEILKNSGLERLFYVMRSKFNMDALEIMKRRRSIRKFKPQPVSDKDVMTIIECGRRAPTMCSLQTYSILWVRNREKRNALWESCRRIQFVIEAPVTLVVCADIRRIVKIAKAFGYESSLEEGAGYEVKLFAVFDSALAAENMVLASEAMGLGSVFYGGACANQKVIEILGIPEGVLPMSLLCIGYPDEDPPTRPRLPLGTVLHMDEYRDPTVDQINEGVRHMTQELTREGYYAKYFPVPTGDWSMHIRRKLGGKKKSENRFIENVETTGFYPFKHIPESG